MRAIPETMPEWRDLVAAVLLLAIRDARGTCALADAVEATAWLWSEDGAVMMEALGLEQGVVLWRLGMA